MAKVKIHITCVFDGEEDIEAIILRSFRLFLKRALIQRCCIPASEDAARMQQPR